ncbi:MAG: NAD(P)-dependent dehydrogenase (short-subunit alcohol dehydrogenase family) [Parasphingorhabdus sp.]|jgi:NAD(P)-dependent dehydrogenase (short-subunit alcohol dehydrogenase family)
MQQLADKVILITGAGSGMGQTHAEVMAQRGGCIVANDINEEGLAETVEKVRAAGGQIISVAGDIVDPEFVDGMVATAIKQFGRVDVLVNNAGIGEHRELNDISLEILNRMFAVHVTGSFLCAKAVVPDMQSRRYGKIINISSIWGMTGYHTASHYCAAKSAMLGATKSWAKEFASDNIHVNAVAPGGVLTPMPIKVQGMEKIREKEKKVPLGRWATPEEISYSVAFLASPESDFITGQVISPNGGETIVGY